MSRRAARALVVPALAVAGAVAATQLVPAAFAPSSASTVSAGTVSASTVSAGTAAASPAAARAAKASSRARHGLARKAVAPASAAGLPETAVTTELILSLRTEADLAARLVAAREHKHWAWRRHGTAQGRQRLAGRARHIAVARRASPALACTGTAGMLPANFGPIVRFLVAHGYTPIAAAGIAGNIYQESMGNPESVGTGGGGLIGWTPLPAGFVTGNVAADLHTQLEALLAYNQQWAQFIPALNAATSAVQAADVYMNYFERPGIPAAANREAAADAVAQACGIG